MDYIKRKKSNLKLKLEQNKKWREDHKEYLKQYRQKKKEERKESI